MKRENREVRKPARYQTKPRSFPDYVSNSQDFGRLDGDILVSSAATVPNTAIFRHAHLSRSCPLRATPKSRQSSCFNERTLPWWKRWLLVKRSYWWVSLTASIIVSYVSSSLPQETEAKVRALEVRTFVVFSCPDSVRSHSTNSIQEREHEHHSTDDAQEKHDGRQGTRARKRKFNGII